MLVAVYWKPESRRMLSRLAIPMWVLVVLHIAAAAGPLRVPLLIAMVTLMVVGFVAEVKQASQQEPEGEANFVLAKTLGWVGVKWGKGGGQKDLIIYYYFLHCMNPGLFIYSNQHF